MKYKTKPVEIEAMEYTGDNGGGIINWANSGSREVIDTGEHLVIKTLEGDMTASIGDFIIKGLRGEFYPCKPDVFHQKYELLN